MEVLIPNTSEQGCLETKLLKGDYVKRRPLGWYQEKSRTDRGPQRRAHGERAKQRGIKKPALLTWSGPPAPEPGLGHFCRSSSLCGVFCCHSPSGQRLTVTILFQLRMSVSEHNQPKDYLVNTFNYMIIILQFHSSIFCIKPVTIYMIF